MSTRPFGQRAARQGDATIYREVLFELADGRAATPLYQALVAERAVHARIQALTLSADAITALFDISAPEAAVSRVREIISSGAQPCVVMSDVLLDAEKHIRFVMTWRRPSDSATEGVSLEHLLFDTVGPGGLLFGRVEGGLITYKAAAPGGIGLTDFLARAQASFQDRFHVRPIRAGPFRPGWEVDDAPRVDPAEQALLSAALANGYYDEPKRCGVRELGDALGVSKSVVARRLRELERRALERMVS